MKKSYILLFGLICIMHIAKAQFVESEECIGDANINSITHILHTSDSGMVVVETDLAANAFPGVPNYFQQIGLVKFSKHHELLWYKKYGDNKFNKFAGIEELKDGYYLYSYKYLDFLFADTSRVFLEIRKLDLNGNIQWMYQRLVSKEKYYDVTPGNFNFVTSKLKNNTILLSCFSTGDSAFHLININTNGTEKWNLVVKYDSIFEHDPWFPTQPQIQYSELGDSTIFVATAFKSSFCSGSCYDRYYNEYRLIDNNGNVLRHRTDSITSIFDGGYYRYVTSTASDYILFRVSFMNQFTKINKTTLQVQSDTLNYWLLENSGYNYYDARKDTSVSQVFLSSLYDTIPSLININLSDKSIIYNVPVDTVSGLAENLEMIKILNVPATSDKIVLYKKYNSLCVAYLNANGTFKYRREFQNHFNANQTLANFDFIGKYNYDDLYTNEVKANIAYNRLSTYYIYKNDNNPYNQKVAVFDVPTGDMLFYYINNLDDNYIVKYVEPYPNETGKIFVLADVGGFTKCHLGQIDIQIKKVLLNANSVNGAAYIDYNNNNTYDGGDVLYNLAMMETSKGSRAVSSFMYGNLYTLNYTDTGAWTTKLILTNNYFTVSPASRITNHPDYNHEDTLQFALHPIATIMDLNINLVNTFVTRLGNDAHYEITYSNNGTHPASGTIKAVMDSRLQYQSSVPAVSSQSGDTLIWDFTNLKANEFRKIAITVTASTPPDLEVGDTIKSSCWIYNTQQIDTTPLDNLAKLNEAVKGSYDPNDKYSTTGETITPAQITNGEYINYVVRFQNVGTDTAFKVIILDTLDSNLDWNTFEMVNASHNFSVQIFDKHILQFTSNNIVLPYASVNEGASHGFVAYKIKPKKTLTVGSNIKNTADIYFDFNAPVKTNTVTTKVLILTRVKQNNVSQGTMRFYPNPNNGKFDIELKTGYASLLHISIYNVEGRLVYSEQRKHDQLSIIPMNIEALAPGFYSVVINTDKEQFSEKIIIEK